MQLALDIEHILLVPMDELKDEHNDRDNEELWFFYGLEEGETT